MFSNGQQIGRYKILSAIGAGGMGEVFLAEDTSLVRTVALKILPAQFASDEQRMRRFVQEAKAAAALNHPNIAYVYEISESGGTHFIAMEYVDGVTLNEKIHREKIPLKKLLKYLVQVTEGLAKAHAAGIVHRDLKPDNIMIARDDYAKILDFGLAKLVEPQRALGSGSEASAGEMATAILAQHSTPGMILGTAGYMSPEQAQGKVREIDHRSDIFSFGCILYEAATGHKAFDGKDVLDSLHKIVHAPTPQIKDFNSAAPVELQRIMRRCLAKDPEERYQIIKDVAIELKELRREMNPESENEGTGASHTTNAPALSSSEDSPTQILAKDEFTQASPTREIAATNDAGAQTTSSAEYLLGEVKRHKRSVLLALIGIVGVIASGIGLYKFVNRSGSTPVPFQTGKMTKLTANGKAINAVISPDGKQVIYVVEDGGQRSLWLRQVATGTDIQLATPEDILYLGLTISPDGNFLYYASGGSIRNRVLYKMSVLGGSPRKVVEDVGSPISFSPDGKQIAFVRNGDEESALMIANADGDGEQKIAVRPRPTNFGNMYEGGTAWSPDGRKIASIAKSTDDKGNFWNVVEIPIEGGAERALTSQKWFQILRLAWLADGSGLLMTAAEQPSDLQSKQIWHLNYSSGEARKVTNDLNNYQNISLNTDSSVLVTVPEELNATIWVAPEGDARRATQIPSVSSKLEGSSGVTWTPDGKIVYHSWASGNEAIWVMEAGGKNKKQLTTGESANFFVSVSTDGRYVVFNSERTGRRTIWRIDIDGSNPKQISDRGNFPQATAEWVIYSTEQGLMKMPKGGGKPVQITKENMVRCAVSHDGRLIAGTLRPPGSTIKLAVISIDGGELLKVFDVGHQLPPRIRWTPDGQAVTYVARQNGVDDIWSQPLDGSAPKKLTDFKSDFIFSFDWSRENQLVISHGNSTSDVVLIRKAN